MPLWANAEQSPANSGAFRGAPARTTEWDTLIPKVVLQIIFWPQYVARVTGLTPQHVVPLESFCNTAGGCART